VMHALEAELNMEPIWTLKQTKHKIFLDIQWTKTKTLATTSNVTKPASCATTTQLLKEAVSAAKPALNTETSAKPDSDKKRKQKKKSPSTRRHDKQRQERWLSQKRRGSNHGRKASSEDSSPSTVGLGTGSKAGTASPCNHNQDPGTVGNAHEESPALSQLNVPPVSRDEEQQPPVADGLSATEVNLPMHDFTEQPLNVCFNLSCLAAESDSIKLKKCLRCNIAMYCSRNCQAEHWKIHRTACGKPLPE